MNEPFYNSIQKRMALCLACAKPRVYFALVCGANLEYYTHALADAEACAFIAKKIL